MFEKTGPLLGEPARDFTYPISESAAPSRAGKAKEEIQMAVSHTGIIIAQAAGTVKRERKRRTVAVRPRLVEGSVHLQVQVPR
jgi:hypothetical protein